jgi:hypothetical protein
VLCDSTPRAFKIRASYRVQRLAALGFSAKTMMVGFPPAITGAIELGFSEIDEELQKVER